MESFAAQNCSCDFNQSPFLRHFGNRCISEDVAHAGFCSPQGDLGEVLHQTRYLVLS
jgi:hypothetical protein